MLRKSYTPRDQYLIVRLTPTEKRRVQSTADAQGLSVSEYIRRLAETPSATNWQSIREHLASCKYSLINIAQCVKSSDVYKNLQVYDNIKRLEGEITSLLQSMRTDT